MALMDYKTARDAETDSVHAFQLAIYAAAGRGEGIDVRAAYVHDLSNSKRLPEPITKKQTTSAKSRAGKLIDGMVTKNFDACPDRRKCRACDMRLLCPHGQGR